MGKVSAHKAQYAARRERWAERRPHPPSAMGVGPGVITATKVLIQYHRGVVGDFRSYENADEIVDFISFFKIT